MMGLKSPAGGSESHFWLPSKIPLSHTRIRGQKFTLLKKILILTSLPPMIRPSFCRKQLPLAEDSPQKHFFRSLGPFLRATAGARRPANAASTGLAFFEKIHHSKSIRQFISFPPVDRDLIKNIL
jgi:hypothetical protein